MGHADNNKIVVLGLTAFLDRASSPSPHPTWFNYIDNLITNDTVNQIPPGLITLTFQKQMMP